MEIDFNSSEGALEKAFEEANAELERIAYDRCSLDARESLLQAKIEYYKQVRAALANPYYKKFREQKCDTDR